MELMLLLFRFFLNSLLSLCAATWEGFPHNGAADEPLAGGRLRVGGWGGRFAGHFVPAPHRSAAAPLAGCNSHLNYAGKAERRTCPNLTP